MLFDPIVNLVLHVLSGVDDILAGIRSALLALMLVAICRLLRSILHVAPGFLDGALYLIGDALICHALVSNCFSNLLFDLAGHLIDFSAHLVLGHDATPV